jgi:hypothetical protein
VGTLERDAPQVDIGIEKGRAEAVSHSAACRSGPALPKLPDQLA